MTQKELSYLEDAIGHEKNIVKLCELSKENMQNKSLISFLDEEINIHNSLKTKILHILEEKANE